MTTRTLRKTPFLFIRGASLAAALAVAACTDVDAPTQPILPSASTSDVVEGAMADDAGAPAVHPTVQQAAARAASLGIQAGPLMAWHGGPIIPNPKVVTIYWSNSRIYTNGPTPGAVGAGTSDLSVVGYFLRHMGGTQFWSINSQYYDMPGGIKRFVPNSLQYTRFWANNTNVPASHASVSDAAIRAMVSAGITAGKLPLDANAVYAVFSGPTVNLGGNFGGSQGYCAYHNRFTYVVAGLTYTLKYAVMPYNADLVGSCTAVNSPGHSPNNDFAADAEVNTLSHELEEAVTDPRLNAWYDTQSPAQENADKCAWTFGTMYTTANGSKANVHFLGRDFLIQRNWRLGSNLSNQTGCSLI
ncbi:MAG: hypothetical protein U0132_21945 [Gemmatimonadaceae bacterium]